MPAVTQRISSYLGGVSRQSDDKMMAGQVRECYNAFPDATYGLTKRPGFKHVVNLGTGLDDARWFYINRESTEKYVGCIKGGALYIWNVITGVACTITYETGAQAYLSLSSPTKNNLKLLTVQDTTIVINNSVNVQELAPVAGTPNAQGTLVLVGAIPETLYTVTLQGETINVTSHINDSSFDDILTDKSGHNLKDAIEAKITARQAANDADFTGTWTVSKVGKTSLRIQRVVSGTATAFTLEAKGGLTNVFLEAFQDEVASVGVLPSESFDGHTVRVLNTDTFADDYYAAFKADNGTSGRGYWEETRAPYQKNEDGTISNVSAGLDNTTLPHELINTSTNTFTFKKISFDNRLVGDNDSNSHPSFINEKITGGFFHNNRLGFLSKDNVSMSRSGDFFNFYFTTAQTVVDDDPIDISCSSVKSTSLHAVLPTAQGIILFSQNQQFVLFSDSGVLTPALATIRTISNYEMDSTVDPVDVGTQINFISKTPGYTRCFSLITRGQQENPQVLDLSRVVKEWIAPGIDQLISSPQNSMIAMAAQDSNQAYIFRYYNNGEKNLMQAWVNWSMPGTTQFITIESDDMYAVTKQGGQFTLSKAALSQSPEQAIIVNNAGQKVNPCVDLYATASSVVYDSTTKQSKCYLPYNDVSELTPVIVIAGNTSTGTFVESGFTVTPSRGTDATGPHFIVQGKDLTSVASDVVVGFKYNFDIHLPTTYFRQDQDTDFTANLTIARMKFSVGLSGVMSFKVTQKGRQPYSISFTGDGSTTTYKFNIKDLNYSDRSDVRVKINGIVTDTFSFTDDTTIEFNSAPAADSTIVLYIDEWFSTQPVIEANQYLANDVPLQNETIFTIPVHQRTENFKLRLFNNTPFPVALNAMMWEGNYTPRFYRRG
jgi:hypothetical protein